MIAFGSAQSKAAILPIAKPNGSFLDSVRDAIYLFDIFDFFFVASRHCVCKSNTQENESPQQPFTNKPLKVDW
uniref:Uncharacterized protein n=1 Tax=Romanomermis culicivorax TaxID=13658 RepID=A0A915KLJ7_ROMCU